MLASAPAHESNCTTGKEDGRGVGRGLAGKRGQHSVQGRTFRLGARVKVGQSTKSLRDSALLRGR